MRRGAFADVFALSWATRPTERRPTNAAVAGAELPLCSIGHDPVARPAWAAFDTSSNEPWPALAIADESSSAMNEPASTFRPFINWHASCSTPNDFIGVKSYETVSYTFNPCTHPGGPDVNQLWGGGQTPNQDVFLNVANPLLANWRVVPGQ